MDTQTLPSGKIAEGISDKRQAELAALALIDNHADYKAAIALLGEDERCFADCVRIDDHLSGRWSQRQRAAAEKRPSIMASIYQKAIDNGYPTMIIDGDKGLVSAFNQECVA